MGHLGAGAGCNHCSRMMSGDGAMEHSVFDAHGALSLDLLRQEGNPEDGHHLMLCIGINALVTMKLVAKSIVALVPHDLHAWVGASGKWEGISLPWVPDVVKIWANCSDNFVNCRAKPAHYHA